MFIWDSANVAHIARHNVTTEEAEQVVQNDPFDLERQLRNGEERFLLLGATKAERVLVVVIAPLGDDIRVVTAYPADVKLRRFYLQQRKKDDGQDPRDT